MSKYTAVIPVRAGSRRLPNKNIAEFGETNLLVEKIRQLKKVSYIDNIVVTSDSDEMLEMAKAEGVITHKRALEYCDEKSKTFGELIAHVGENVEGENIIWATCTSPLVLPSNYSQAIEEYEQAIKEGYDSLMSVEPFKRFMWDDEGPINYELGIKHVPSQELKQLYFVTDGILIAPRIKMIEWKYFHGTKPYKYILKKIHCIDIDDMLDLEVAKAWKNLI